MRKTQFLRIIFCTSVLSSCNNPSVEQDVERYCECRNTLENNLKPVTACSQILKEIIDKYEFDPEASEIITEKVKNCNRE
jgi:DNA repair ATPase RecN